MAYTLSALSFFLFLSSWLYIPSRDDKSMPAPYEESNAFFLRLRDKAIVRDEAVVEFKALVPQLGEYYYRNGGKDFPRTAWVFPVQGYDQNSIGGTKGSGYVPSLYNFFNYNHYSGHPAHDIFIFDLNRDCLDDRTKKPVQVLSLSGGIVVSREAGWMPGSTVRGGNSLWIFDPSTRSLFFYAHNREIFVKPGDIVQPGDLLATVGRTGLNAFKRRSPTHLHVMRLELDSTNYPRPKNLYHDLVKAKMLK
jgi:murein DD-endopeptidase MepM/ murein hydrolase activator NlpD